MKLAEKLPKNATGRIIQNQFLRCGTSVGANYRAAMRGRSPADCVAKLGIVEEEVDESMYWMDLMVDGGLLPVGEVEALRGESEEILAMTVASIRTIKANHRKP
jgi:four helix bundle protein